MKKTEIDNNVHELRELLRMQDELSAEIDAIKDALKTAMTEGNVDELLGTDYKVTWKAVSSNRIDTRALKAALPEIAQKYTKTSTTRRFCLA